MRHIALVTALLLACSVSAFAQPATQPTTQPLGPGRGGARGPAPLNPNLPTLWIASDSTAASGNRGWGSHMSDYLDTTKLNIANRAAGGQSSRTYISSGNWGRLIGQVKQGDFVIIQFGHNDISEINDARVARGVIQSLGEETQEIDNLATKQKETVHTFGWYMRKMIAETKEKGATPIVASMTVRNHWTDGKLERGANEMARFAVQIARNQKVQCVDLNTMAADILEPMGQEKLTVYFSADRTHTTVEGADFNARQIAIGLKSLKETSFEKFLTEKGKAPVAP